MQIPYQGNALPNDREVMTSLPWPQLLPGMVYVNWRFVL